MKKVLIVGVSSCIGSNAAKMLRDRFLVYGTYASNSPQIDGVPFFNLKLTPQTPIENVLNFFRPDAVLYCAGNASYTYCSEEPLSTLFIHAEAPLKFARCLSKWNGQFIYLSSSKVFYGDKGNYLETDVPAPQDNYGLAKLNAEEKLLTLPNVTILRLGTIYGFGSLNGNAVLNRILKALRQKEAAPFVNDEKRTFMSAEELATAITRILATKTESSNVYHLGNGTAITYFELATSIADALELNSSHLVPLPRKEFAEIFQKGDPNYYPDLSLKGDTFSTAFGFEYLTLKNSLSKIRVQLQSGTQ